MNHYITGATIKALRESCGMTQAELAQQIGVSSKAVSKWENNLCCPDIMLLPKLAKIFGITIDALFDNAIARDGGSMSDAV